MFRLIFDGWKIKLALTCGTKTIQPFIKILASLIYHGSSDLS